MIKVILQMSAGLISLLLYGINTVIWTLPMFIIAIFKFLIPIAVAANFFRLIMNYLAGMWVFCNNMNQKFFSCVRWDVKGVEKLSMNDWYMVIANHQSWVDILVLQNVFYKKIPFLKFFIKRELFWFPFLGQAWWALEFPFVKRYSKKKLRKNPSLVGKDLEITKVYCEKFAKIPISIMNFVEGTRFTSKKHFDQKSKYRNLLRAKAGGLAFVMESMGGKLRKVLDVTIAYPNKRKSFWAFLCGQVGEIKVRVKVHLISGNMIGDYIKDSYYRDSFQSWLNNVWLEKDKRLSQLIAK